MVDTANDFTQIFLTYKDIRDANPKWSDKMVEDYLALKRDLADTADTADDNSDLGSGVDPYCFALITQLRIDIGSGNFLTSDETGFTVDTDKLTVDMDEA